MYGVVVAVIAAIAAAPIVVAALSVFKDTGDVWVHLAQYVLPEALIKCLQ